MNDVTTLHKQWGLEVIVNQLALAVVLVKPDSQELDTLPTTEDNCLSFIALAGSGMNLFIE